MGKYAEVVKQLQDEFLSKRATLDKRYNNALNKMKVNIDKYILMDSIENYDLALKNYLLDKFDSENMKITSYNGVLTYSISYSEDETTLISKFQNTVNKNGKCKLHKSTSSNRIIC